MMNPFLPFEIAVDIRRFGQVGNRGITFAFDQQNAITCWTDRDQRCGGGIENIPFLQSNADSALVYATFWITTVSHPKRKESFLQLQYAQMVLLNFPILAAGPKSPVLSWPHITVGTLTRDFG